MHIDEQLVSKLSDLARIEVTDGERRVFASQLPQIVDYVGHLQSVSAELIPAAGAKTERRRPDDAAVSGRVDDILAGAPDRLDRFWKVPAVF